MDAPPRPATAKTALALYDNGWHPIPLPLGRKGPPPDGLTGAAGVDLTREQVAAGAWSGNLAVRPAGDQLGIDVDAYKGGLVTLRALVAELGPLPRSVVSHSGRNDGSGIYWYRVPAGVRWIAGLPGIEVIQRTHRYAVVHPSTHPDHGGTYAWHDQAEDGALEGVPRADDLPDLPWKWIERLTRGPLADGTTSAGVAPPSEVEAFVVAHADARATRFLDGVLEHFAAQVAAGLSRHDTMTHCLAWALGEARAGDYPAAAALEALGVVWTTVMDVPRRAALESPGRATEWQGMVGWAVRRAEALTADELASITDDHQGLPLDDEPVLEAEGAEPIDDEPTPATSSPGDYFGPKGLLALNLANAVRAIGPLELGIDGRLWRYRDGVYLDDGDAIARQRVGRLLKNRYRTAHRSTVVDMLTMSAPRDPADAPERLINVANGLLDWRVERLQPHTPRVFSTYRLQVPWRPRATCPTVDTWLAEVVDIDVVELVWEVVGMAIYPGLPFHRAVMLSGSGRNGKGTLLRLIRALVGARHCAAVSLQQLGEDRFAAAQLFGKVVNLAGDLEARAIASTGTFKMATGDDLISAQRKYGQPFEMVNRALMIFAANELPTARDHTLGYESRWVVVPFTRVTLAPGEEDKTLEPRMHGELEGVLVRAVAGMRRAIERGEFLRPPSVVAATEAFQRAGNPVHAFVEDCLEVTGLATDEVSRDGVYAAYADWSRRSGHGTMSARRFWPKLTESYPLIDTGVTEANRNGHRRGGVRIVYGVRLESGMWP